MFTLIDVIRRRNAAPTHGLCESVSIHRRVGLTDIDLNLHLNNAKYLKYMDLARLENMLANGLMWKFMRAGIRPIITNTEIAYIRELRTWQEFSVSAQILGYDEKYLYSEQRFTSHGKLCTHAFTRLACVRKGKAQPVAETFARLGITQVPPPLPEPVLIWKDMLDAKKAYALGVSPNPHTPHTKQESNTHVA